ncbi:DUF3108 domain-containing protein [Azospirillum halopraeferens]|uniref:DUF3108 domain-containing protein n=1 Tax=Azospirillum halopraeferens TaxID=34010 RepID=UPI00041F2A99|nr:DUF3108 domain-containing protein [Azospirillum halopraeferens]
MAAGAALALLAAAVPGRVAGAAVPATPAPVELRYAVHVGGFHLLDVTVEARLLNGRYELTGQAASRGFLDWFSPLRSQFSAAGVLEPGGARPERYRADRTWRGRDRSVTLAYDGSAVTEAVEPPSARDERDPVPDPLKPGTLDPLSAGLSAMLAVFRDGRCGGTSPVFDGMARYDLIAGDAGAATLPAARYGLYAGPAIRCTVEPRMLAGFWRGDGDRPRPQEGERRTASLWLARIGPGGLPLPVRAEVDGWFGAAVVHLVGGSGLMHAAAGAAGATAGVTGSPAASAPPGG